MEGQAVKNGDKIKVHYIGKLKDGTVFDTTEGRDGFSFVVGSKNVIRGMHEAVIGMKIGEKKTIEVQAADAFGEYDASLKIQVEKNKLPEDIAIDDLVKDSETGKEWHVQKFEKDKVFLDGNHILAGKLLFFDIELLSIYEEEFLI